MNFDKNRKLVLTYINKNIKPDTKSKQLLGEVFTPMSWVDKMLNMIPVGVWKDPNKKWLDPCCGIGNFMFAVYWKLMDTLKTVKNLENDTVRSKHIIEKMLFMVEYSEKNTIILKNLFKIIDKTAKINVFQEDFLTWNYGNNTKFDVVVMNPPYNTDGTKASGRKNVYVFFAIRALGMLNVDGFYLTVHPAAYRLGHYKPRATKIDINEIYTRHNILEIAIYTTWQTYESMYVQTNVDMILIKKQETNNGTKIEDIYGEKHIIKVNPHDTIPSFGYSIMSKLFELCNKYGSIYNLVHHSSEIHHDAWKKGVVNEGKYEIIHSMKKKGNTIYMCDKKHTYQTTPKIIINGLGVKYVYFDKE